MLKAKKYGMMLGRGAIFDFEGEGGGGWGKPLRGVMGERGTRPLKCGVEFCVFFGHRQRLRSKMKSITSGRDGT